MQLLQLLEIQWCICVLSGRHSMNYCLLLSIVKHSFSLSKGSVTWRHIWFKGQKSPNTSISGCSSLDYCVVIWIAVLSWWFVPRSFFKICWALLLTHAVETGVMQRKIQQGILYPSYQAVYIAMVSHVLIIPLGVSSCDVPLFFHFYSLYLSIISLLAFR